MQSLSADDKRSIVAYRILFGGLPRRGGVIGGGGGVGAASSRTHNTNATATVAAAASISNANGRGDQRVSYAHYFGKPPSASGSQRIDSFLASTAAGAVSAPFTSRTSISLAGTAADAIHPSAMKKRERSSSSSGGGVPAVAGDVTSGAPASVCRLETTRGARQSAAAPPPPPAPRSLLSAVEIDGFSVSRVIRSLEQFAGNLLEGLDSADRNSKDNEPGVDFPVVSRFGFASEAYERVAIGTFSVPFQVPYRPFLFVFSLTKEC